MAIAFVAAWIFFPGKLFSSWTCITDHHPGAAGNASESRRKTGAASDLGSSWKRIEASTAGNYSAASTKNRQREGFQMSPENKDKSIKITMDDLANVSVPDLPRFFQPPRARAEQRFTGRSTKLRIADPSHEEKGSLLLQGWFYLGVCGLGGGAAWLGSLRAVVCRWAGSAGMAKFLAHGTSRDTAVCGLRHFREHR